MRPEPGPIAVRPPIQWLVLAPLLALTLTACASLGGKPRDGVGESLSETAPDRNAVQAQALAFYLELLHRFAKAGPGEQAEMFANMQREFDTQPSPSSQLHFALALATPDHAAADPARAQSLLRELLEAPQQLSAAEHAAAYLELLKLDRELGLLAETRRLQAEAERMERDRLGALQRRLQTETDENGRLRRALEDAQSKLDAIANIERGTATRKPSRQTP